MTLLYLSTLAIFSTVVAWFTKGAASFLALLIGCLAGSVILFYF
ncbi:hypothetical protein FYL99_RS20280 [Escherichia coli]